MRRHLFVGALLSLWFILIIHTPVVAANRFVRFQYQNEHMSNQSSLQDYPAAFGNAPFGVPVDVIIKENSTGFNETINEITKGDGLITFDPDVLMAPTNSEVTFKIYMTLKEQIDLSSDDVVEDIKNQLGYSYFIRVGPILLSNFPLWPSVKNIQIISSTYVHTNNNPNFDVGLANTSLHVLDSIRHVFDFFSNQSLPSFSFTGFFDDLSIEVSNAPIGSGYAAWLNKMSLQAKPMSFPNSGILHLTEGDKELVPAWNKYVIAHEYGHVIDDFNELTALNSILYLPPPHHGMTLETNQEAALVEGWAEFVQGIAFNTPTPDLAYKQNFKSSLQMLGLSLENNSWWKGKDNDGTNNSGEVVEGAIASILWDMTDRVDYSARFAA